MDADEALLAAISLSLAVESNPTVHPDVKPPTITSETKNNEVEAEESKTVSPLDETPKKAKKEKKKCAPYVALQLRNLPAAFQEPQLRKFLSQFGVPIAQCFVLRTVERATSRGLAYIRFAPQRRRPRKAHGCCSR